MSMKGSDGDKNEQEYIESWEKVYSQKENPFDVNEPNEWVVELETQRKIGGLVLDSGCGTGDNALYLAAKGHAVLGIDISTKAIERAKEKAVAVIFLRAFSTANAKRKGYKGPQVSEEQIRVAFSDGWRIDRLEQKDMDVKLSAHETVKTNAWFAEVVRL